jgi:hypothetical protein
MVGVSTVRKVPHLGSQIVLDRPDFGNGVLILEEQI